MFTLNPLVENGKEDHRVLDNLLDFREPLIKSGAQIAQSDFSSDWLKAAGNPWWISEDF